MDGLQQRPKQVMRYLIAFLVLLLAPSVCAFERQGDHRGYAGMERHGDFGRNPWHGHGYYGPHGYGYNHDDHSGEFLGGIIGGFLWNQFFQPTPPPPPPEDLK